IPVIVNGQAQNGPVASPSAVTVSSLDRTVKGQEIQRILIFARHGKFKVLGVDTGNRGLVTKVDREAPGSFYYFVLNYAGGWNPGPVTGSIRVTTDDKTTPVLTIPYRIFVR